MSITGVATLAKVRTNTRKDAHVTRGDIGKATGTKKADKAKTLDVLVTMVPTAAVAFYTAGLAAIVGAVAKPTRRRPQPNELVGLRVAAFVVLIVLALAAVLIAYYADNEPSDRVPVAEVLATFVAAAAWGLASPGSLIFVTFNPPMRAVLPLLIGAAGVGILAAMAPLLKRAPRNNHLRPRACDLMYPHFSGVGLVRARLCAVRSPAGRRSSSWTLRRACVHSPAACCSSP